MGIERSAGIVIIWSKKILLCHSPRSKWFGSYMPPKGKIEKGESIEEAACRETLEEVGIDINTKDLSNMYIIPYTKGKRKYKEVYIFEYRINSLLDLGLESETLPKIMLQLNEVDDAKFMDYEEASVRILPRYNEFLNSILNN